MKNKIIAILLSTVFGACSTDRHEADAFGNFETEEIIVSAEANGKLLYFKVAEGEILKKNQLIGCVDTSVLYIQMEQLITQKELVKSKIFQIKAQQDVYKTQLENITNEKNRLEKLFQDGAATDKQMDDVKGQLKVAEKQLNLTETQFQTVQKEVESINKQLKLLRLQLNKCYIINPVNGTVLEKYIEAYELVTVGRSLYKIAPLNMIFLRAYVSETQLSLFSIGDTVQVFCDAPDKNKKEFEGIVSYVSSNAEFTPKVVQTEEERVNLVYAIKVSVINDGSLKIGMPGEVKFK